MTRQSSLVLVVLPLVALAHGCGSTVVVEADDGAGAGAACCKALPTCPDDANEVTTCPDGTCFTVEACCTTALCHPRCNFGPQCAAGETQVQVCPSDWRCHEVEACGTKILCGAGFPCQAEPECDPGDGQFCSPKVSCYEVTLCGQTIVCADTALPQHGCPLQEPPRGTPCCGRGDECFDEPELCDYSNGPCFSSYACSDGADPTWVFVGGGCDG